MSDWVLLRCAGVRRAEKLLSDYYSGESVPDAEDFHAGCCYWQHTDTLWESTDSRYSTLSVEKDSEILWEVGKVTLVDFGRLLATWASRSTSVWMLDLDKVAFDELFEGQFSFLSTPSSFIIDILQKIRKTTLTLCAIITQIFSTTVLVCDVLNIYIRRMKLN